MLTPVTATCPDIEHASRLQAIRFLFPVTRKPTDVHRNYSRHKGIHLFPWYV
jgi:hypothetical protein